MTGTSERQLKSTPFEWIGAIPEHWSTRRFRHCFRESSETNGFEVVGEMLSISGYRGVEVKQYSSDSQKRDADQLESYRVVRKGQLAMNTMWLNYAGLGVSEYEGHMSPAYRSYNFTFDANPRYIHYLLRSSSYVEGYTSHLQGVRPNSLQMSRDSLMNLPILNPPLDEQKAIADFLDRELAQIDALITKQELFEIVSQQRINSSILSAITGDGALALDPSSSEIWSGDLPSGWSVRKLSHLFGSIGSGTTPTSDSAEYYGGTVPWVTTGELRETTILETSRYVTEKAMKDFSALKLHPQGSLVIAMYGATVGRLGFLGMDATVNQACCVMSKPLGVDIEYVYFALQGLREVLVSLATGGGQPNISQGLLKSFMIPVPSHQNQIEIRELLEIEMKQHNALQETNGRILATLRERRQSLISAAVTGKIDVRKVA